MRSNTAMQNQQLPLPASLPIMLLLLPLPTKASASSQMHSNTCSTVSTAPTKHARATMVLVLGWPSPNISPTCTTAPLLSRAHQARAPKLASVYLYCLFQISSADNHIFN